MKKIRQNDGMPADSNTPTPSLFHYIIDIIKIGIALFILIVVIYSIIKAVTL